MISDLSAMGSTGPNIGIFPPPEEVSEQKKVSHTQNFCNRYSRTLGIVLKTRFLGFIVVASLRRLQIKKTYSRIFGKFHENPICAYRDLYRVHTMDLVGKPKEKHRKT